MRCLKEPLDAIADLGRLRGHQLVALHRRVESRAFVLNKRCRLLCDGKQRHINVALDIRKESLVGLKRWRASSPRLNFDISHGEGHSHWIWTLDRGNAVLRERNQLRLHLGAFLWAVRPTLKPVNSPGSDHF